MPHVKLEGRKVMVGFGVVAGVGMAQDILLPVGEACGKPEGSPAVEPVGRADGLCPWLRLACMEKRKQAGADGNVSSSSCLGVARRNDDFPFIHVNVIPRESSYFFGAHAGKKH